MRWGDAVEVRKVRPDELSGVKICETCGQEFSRPKRRGTLQWNRRRFCSPSCVRCGPMQARFWKAVRKGAPDECWLWLKCLTAGPGGYGVFYVGRERYRAHRVAYELCLGPVPPGMLVLHRCDVPACVNPAHLFLGTHGDNMCDMQAKGRDFKAYGERAAKAKLSIGQVREIRVKHAAGVSYRRLGLEYAINRNTARAAVVGQSWRSVP